MKTFQITYRTEPWREDKVEALGYGLDERGIFFEFPAEDAIVFTVHADEVLNIRLVK